ncbi:phage virion morphogenesis protein [Rhodoferax sp.]|uniref:phage virion morphogenesis protein n=1 Tax=Rhodoferax sp. TaxID=50421 RepID=UPI0026148B8C|nr:phage virion morphogenesis protein [Rhodoferax sp.]MDD5479687.1 phage virion morphogenesis protein [Rhodoferax sp.]
MITIEVKDQEASDMLRQLSARVKDMRPAMAEVANALASESERQFKTQSGPLGKWPDLSDETTKVFRTRKGSWPGQILQVSAGGLAASVQTSFGADFASVGSNKPYAAMHMFGGVTSPKSMIPGKRIAARPFLPFNPQTQALSVPAREAIVEILNNYLAHR